MARRIWRIVQIRMTRTKGVYKMSLTPLDIQHKEFPVKIKGYDKEQVNDFLDTVTKEFEEKFKKQIEAYPVPGGVQRMISSYCLPAPEKTKSAEE